jgi:hypothetical protein
MVRTILAASTRPALHGRLTILPVVSSLVIEAGGRKAAKRPMACKAATWRFMAFGVRPMDLARPLIPSSSRTPDLASALALAVGPFRDRRLRDRQNAIHAGQALALVMAAAVSSEMSGTRT